MNHLLNYGRCLLLADYSVCEFTYSDVFVTPPVTTDSAVVIINRHAQRGENVELLHVQVPS